MSKKSMIALALVSALGTGIFAAEKSASTKGPSFMEIRNASITSEKAASIKSAKLVYRITGKNIPESFCMIRVKQYDKIRFDALKGDELFTAARNGESFWIYNKKDGSIAMPQEDATKFTYFMAFLPLSFTQAKIFSDPTFVEDTEVNGEKRSGYAIHSLDDSGVSYVMWVNKKNRQLRKVEIVNDDGRVVVSFYRDFRTVNGIKLPGTISTTNEKGTFTMTLVTADWNVELDESIFKKGTKITDDHVALLMKIPAVKEAKAAKKKKAQDKKRIDALERKIGKLKIEIAAAERELDTLAAVSKSDREKSASVAKTTSSSNNYSGYWNGDHWTHHSSTDRAASRDARNRSRTIDRMQKEAKQISSDYQKKSKKLVELQIQLDEAERDLKNLTEE